jgi:hypothetical protein
MLFPLKPRSDRRPTKFCVFDLEAEKWINEFMIGFYDGRIYETFRGNDCVAKFLDFFLVKKYQSYTCFAHNGGRYDFQFLLQEILKNRSKIFKVNLIKSSARILRIKVNRPASKRNWYFSDSYALLPSSLDKLTNGFNVPHKKLKDVDYDNIKNDPNLEKYLEFDCRGLYEVIDQFRETFDKLGVGLKTTIAQQSLSAFRTTMKAPILCVKDKEGFIRQAYFGGRTELFKTIGENLLGYDINSLYPYCQWKYPMPVGSPNKFRSWQIINDGYLGFAECVVKCPDIHIPLLPIRYKAKLVFPTGKFRGTWDLDEIRKAKELGYKIKILKGYAFHKEFLFKDFVSYYYNIKRKIDRNNPMYIISKLIMNCFNPKTEIWTKNGIKNVKDMKVGDVVYSINPKTLEVELKPVTHVWEYDYNGKMVKMNHSHGLDFLVTPEHKFLLKNWYHQDFRFIKAGDITSGGSWKFPPFSSIKGKIQKKIKIGKFEFDFNDWLELIGWYISEGTLYVSKKENTKYVMICQKTKKGREKIKTLLERMGFVNQKQNRWNNQFLYYRMSPDGFKFTVDSILDWLKENCRRGSFNKIIPNFLLDYDHSHIQHLYQTMMDGDGSFKHNSKNSIQTAKYSTVSKELALQFQQLCIHLGLRTKIVFEESKDKSRPSIYRIFIYSVPCAMQKHPKRNNITSEDYKGKIYCVTVKDNHTVLAGRNGCFNFTGQSNYGKFAQRRENEIIIINPDPEEIKGLKTLYMELNIYTKAGVSNSSHIIPSLSAHITACSRLELYNWFEQVGMDHVYYCDTDSIFTDKPLPTSEDLGGLKKEYDVKKAIFVSPKFYFLRLNDGTTRIRMKGFTDPQFKEEDFMKALAGDFTPFKFEKQVFGTFSESLRRFRSPIQMIDKVKSIRTKYCKRRVDGTETHPISFNKLDKYFEEARI